MKGYKFIVSDYYATGEGTTISLMIAPEFYGEEYTKKHCKEVFTDYYASMCEEVSYEKFMEYKNHFPSIVMRYLTGEAEPPGGFYWVSQTYINF
jgi:hypothetical protein